MTTDDARAKALESWNKLWSEAEDDCTPTVLSLGCWALDHEDVIRSALTGSDTKALREAVRDFGNVGCSHEIISLMEKHATTIAECEGEE